MSHSRSSQTTKGEHVGLMVAGPPKEGYYHGGRACLCYQQETCFSPRTPLLRAGRPLCVRTGRGRQERHGSHHRTRGAAMSGGWNQLTLSLGLRVPYTGLRAPESQLFPSVVLGAGLGSADSGSVCLVAGQHFGNRADVKYPWGTPLDAGACLRPAQPYGSDLLGGAMPRPRRSEAGEGRARRKTRVLEERDETQCGAVGLERTEGEQKEETTKGGHRTEQRAFVERRPRGTVSDEEASHVPGGPWLFHVQGRAGEGGVIIGWGTN
ncbi:hypothetical protein NDU88_003923 [Pleurodeles waltl]|uniref:Uncharacterized protein n=1 Tax=Pleurodeles waltl TaxID=8319 RepID=A0AAV7T708_PLEWA|nr:hypothetical protein NDU88_003923 [Pleurodeles waltl]